MATVLRKTSPIVQHLADAFNDMKGQIGAGALFHLDAFEQPVSAAAATTLPTLITLANQCLAIYKAHIADTLAHKAADATDVEALGPCVDQTTALALMTDLCTQYEAHRVLAAAHYNVDATNSLTSTTCDTLAHTQTVATDFKAKLNLHMASAPAAKSLRVVAG